MENFTQQKDKNKEFFYYFVNFTNGVAVINQPYARAPLEQKYVQVEQFVGGTAINSTTPFYYVKTPAARGLLDYSGQFTQTIAIISPKMATTTGVFWEISDADIFKYEAGPGEIIFNLCSGSTQQTPIDLVSNGIKVLIVYEYKE